MKLKIPASLNNISGTLKDEIGTIVRFYNLRLKSSYEKLLNKGVLGKKLNDLIANPPGQINPEFLNYNCGTFVSGIEDRPETFEDWAARNPKKI